MSLRLRRGTRPPRVPPDEDPTEPAADALRRAEEALRESEEKLRKLFQTSLDAIAINTLEEGKYLEVNDEFVRLTGFAREDVIGRTAREIGIWCDPEQLRFVLREIARNGIVRNLEGDFRAKDGSIVAALFSAERITIGAKPCILSIVRDVRQRKRAEEAVRESERRYRALFEEANDLIFVADARGLLTDVNPAGVALLGCRSKEEVLATGTGEVFYEKPETHAELLRRLRDDGRIQDVEVDLRRRDGKRLKMILNAAPLHDSGGSIIGVLGSLRDVTERTRLQEQLLQSQRMEAVGRLAGGIAHDFNNLLTVIRASAGLALLDLPVGHPLRARIEEIDEAAQRSAELTSQLLAFARRQVVLPSILDPNQLIRNLERMLRRVIGEDVELVARLFPGVGSVRADRGQLEQVVMNLAVNARDAMPDGGTLVLETSNVTVAGEGPWPAGMPPGDYVRIVVRDTGRGIPEEARAHVFEPFFTTKEAGKGTGLGLATCYGIVTQGGGAIDVESEIGQGSSFRVFLPRVLESPAAASAGTRREVSGGRETLLLLEDEPAVRRLAAETLRGLGYAVLETAAAEEAVERLRQPGGDAIDLFVSDVVLPRMSGPEVAERVREVRPNVRVLFISGHPNDSRLERGLREGRTSFLRKPFTPDELGAAVRRMLDGDA